MKTGLVLEGGAMRGMFTAGVLDVLMENGITVDGAIGVSAGAVFGCNYKSHQIGRTIRYNTQYCNDKRYASFKNLLRTGNLYSEQFCYHDVPEKLDPFDEKAFAVTVNVTGALNDEEADIAARAVANSPLVKTCIAGHDCNWGRVAMALGKCGVKFNQEDVSIDMMGMPVCRDGLTVPFDEDEALRRFEASEIVISADLGAGDAATTVWTCDLTHEYISINGDYRS